MPVSWSSMETGALRRPWYGREASRCWSMMRSPATSDSDRAAIAENVAQQDFDVIGRPRRSGAGRRVRQWRQAAVHLHKTPGWVSRASLLQLEPELQAALRRGTRDPGLVPWLGFRGRSRLPDGRRAWSARRIASRTEASAGRVIGSARRGVRRNRTSSPGLTQTLSRRRWAEDSSAVAEDPHRLAVAAPRRGPGPAPFT